MHRSIEQNDKIMAKMKNVSIACYYSELNLTFYKICKVLLGLPLIVF